jgi:hypothetical protein
MIVAALRRFALLLVSTAVGTAVVSLLIGLAAGAAASRSVSIGFYCVGSFLLLFGFFAGNRGPVRQQGEHGMGFWIPLPGRMLRWASPGEQEESINLSAVFITLGLVLILLGVVADSRYSLI